MSGKSQWAYTRGFLAWERGGCCSPLDSQGTLGRQGTSGIPEPQRITLSYPPTPSPSVGAARVHTILQDLGLSPGASDAKLVQDVCAAVCTRAAQLCAAALAAVLSRLQHSREQQTLQIAVATGGRVFERHPRYWEYTGSCVSR